MASFPEEKRDPRLSKSDTQRKVVVVLQQASLESVKTKKGYELLNCDEHVGMHLKAGRDPAQSRPDITHQLLLALLDSPLNKAGYLKVYIETVKGVLIEVSPHIRIPRTFKRFAGLMVQLLQKMKVRAADSNETLMKVIKNPVTDHLPIGAPIIGLEVNAKLVDTFDLPGLIEAACPAPRPGGGAGGGGAGAPKVTCDRPVVFVIGAMSHGDIKPDLVQQTYSLSRYPLSAACAVSKLLNAFEHAWGVI